MPNVKRVIIVAMTRDRLIGAAGRIPWHIPEELELFRKLTEGHTLIMGRNTFVSIGRPLPNRRILVVSRQQPPVPGVEICPDLGSALERADHYAQTTFFAGGVGIYRAGLALADEMSVSWIKGDYSGDTYFPEFAAGQWQAVATKEYALFQHVRYRRIPEFKVDESRGLESASGG